jgi:hypothetical protein
MCKASLDTCESSLQNLVRSSRQQNVRSSHGVCCATISKLRASYSSILLLVLVVSLMYSPTFSLAFNSQASAYSVTSLISRPLDVRLWQQDQFTIWTLERGSSPRHEIDTPFSIGTAIGKLHPSWITDVFYIGSGGTGSLEGQDQFGQNLIRSYNIFRNAVLQSSPNTKFDVKISLASPLGDAPRNPLQIMKLINSQVKVDGFSFDYWWKLRNYPSVYRSVISYAHSRGQFVVGGILYGSGNVLPGQDVAVSPLYQNQTKLTRSDLNVIKNMEQKFPSVGLVFLISSNPQNPGANYWMLTSTSNRERILRSQVTELAHMSVGYIYSVCNPLYPVYVAYDANRDGNMMSVINTTMSQVG